MYSTKNIDRILINTYKKSLVADALNENTKNKYKPLNKEIVLDYLNNEFSDAWKAYFEGHILYRGIKKYFNYSDFTYVVPGIRVSADSSNIYTKLISDILPSWRNYPKRSNSTICTTSKSTALYYTKNSKSETSTNGVLVVFPRNGAKIAVASTDDMWGSFHTLTENGIDELDSFNYRFALFIKVVLSKIDNKEYNLNDINKYFLQGNNKILKIFNKIEYFIKQINKNQLKQFISNIYDAISTCVFFEELIMSIYSGGTIIDFLDIILNPKENGFSLMNIKQISQGNREVWFSSDYITIKLTSINELMK